MGACVKCWQTKQMIERLQTLVSSDGRFKNMREALHRFAIGGDSSRCQILCVLFTKD